jgi:uncharacterized phiE125 gp8 family phage protein
VRYRELLGAPYNAASKIKTKPTMEPVSVDEVHRHCRIDTSLEAQHVAALIEAVRQEVEAITGRQFITATWELYLDALPCDGVIELPHQPLRSVSGVEYRDEDGTWRTFDAADYEEQTFYSATESVDIDLSPGRIVLLPDVEWPDLYDAPASVRITFVAGHADDAARVPARAKQAMLHRIAESFERRELGVAGTIYTPTRTFSDLVRPLVVR